LPKLAIAIAVSLLAGLAIGALLVGGRPGSEATVLEPAEPANGSEDERLLRLEQMLFEEREARIALEDTLALLFEEIDGTAGQERPVASDREARQARQAVELEEARRVDRSNWALDYNKRRVDRMVESGFTEEEARNLIEQESAASYAAMRAAWEAQRNGEAFDPYAAWNDPQRILRESIGDDAYERYLESQGQPTTVQVMQVLSGSPGARVGLEPGDQIARYNGERIFSVSDLRQLTMQGSPGEDVVIDIVRDGVAMQLTVPAGPIGVTGSGARTRGINWWGG
jgi:hypothetical protein